MLAAFATVEEYLDYIAANRSETREHLRKWMARMELTAIQCHCPDYEHCRGWRLEGNEFLEST